MRPVNGTCSAIRDVPPEALTEADPSGSAVAKR